MKTLDFLNNETINEKLSINLDNYDQFEEYVIYINLWGDNSSILNLVINHNAKNTKSRIKIRAVLKDQAKLSINGLVKIQKGMKGSDTYFDARILTLSQHATGIIVPSLEIDEMDVKAGHSASVTNISDRDMFYLTSRGISIENSTKLIEQGFLRK